MGSQCTVQIKLVMALPCGLTCEQRFCKSVLYLKFSHGVNQKRKKPFELSFFFLKYMWPIQWAFSPGEQELSGILVKFNMRISAEWKFNFEISMNKCDCWIWTTAITNTDCPAKNVITKNWKAVIWTLNRVIPHVDPLHWPYFHFLFVKRQHQPRYSNFKAIFPLLTLVITETPKVG